MTARRWTSFEPGNLKVRTGKGSGRPRNGFPVRRMRWPCLSVPASRLRLRVGDFFRAGSAL